MELLEQVAAYWSKRTIGYTDVINKELHNEQKESWGKVLTSRFPLGDKENLKILDIGTGPGFFAMILAEEGYHVTAIDYTQAMIEKAKANVAIREKEIGKELSSYITFIQMDAQNLSFENETFDVILSRNLTWNLPEPERAYSEWYRVLKFGGKVLNFDANWYHYLYDSEKQEEFQKDRENVKKAGLTDCNLAEDIDHEQDEKIARQMPLSLEQRPAWDIRVLKSIMFSQVIVNEEIWKEVWDEEDRINNASTPMFLVEAVKAVNTEKDRIVSYWTKRSDSFIEQRRRELHGIIGGGKMERKIVFFDVDGTLVDEKGKVPESAARAIRQLRKNGHLAIINSGRTLFDLEGNKEVASPGFDGYICGCGTHIRVHGEDLQCAVIPKDFHSVLLASAQKHHIRLFLEGPAGVYIDMENKASLGQEKLLNRLKDSLNQISDTGMCIQKFLSWADKKEEMYSFAEDMKPILIPIYKEDGCGEFVMNGYDKGKSICYLLEHFGLTQEDCYVFGDSANDITMFEHCVHSVLMGNGSENLKDQVEYVTAAVNENGIEQALKHYGLI